MRPFLIDELRLLLKSNQTPEVFIKATSRYVRVHVFVSNPNQYIKDFTELLYREEINKPLNKYTQEEILLFFFNQLDKKITNDAY